MSDARSGGAARRGQPKKKAKSKAPKRPHYAPVPDAWLARGFTAEQARRWRQHIAHPDDAIAFFTHGFAYEAAGRWKAAGFSPDVAAQWRRVGAEPAEAVAWQRFGVAAPAAGALRRRGWTPRSLESWEQKASIDSARAWIRLGWGPDAFVWHDLGWDPVRAESWRDAGLTPREAQRWSAERWNPSLASAWQEVGVEPSYANRWRQIARLVRDPVEWYRTGFDPEEAEPWATTGLAPRVAIAWRDAEFAAADAASWAAAGWASTDAFHWRARGYNVSAIHWTRAGVTEPDDVRSWLDAGFDAASIADIDAAAVNVADLVAFAADGWAPSEACRWIRAALSPDVAQRWTDAGFDAASAQQWNDAGFEEMEAGDWRQFADPNVARRWRSLKPDVEFAKRWLLAGFTDAAEALRWEEGGGSPEEATQWRAAGFDLGAASKWKAEGFERGSAAQWRSHKWDAEEARTWRDAEWDPSPARPWANRRFTPDEAAAWVVAGFSPKSARKAADLGRVPLAQPPSTLAVQRPGTAALAEAPAPVPVPAGFDPLESPRPVRRADQLLGSPRNAEELARWVSVTKASSPPLVVRHSALREQFAPGARFRSGDVPLLRTMCVDRLLRSGAEPWESWLAALVTNAAPFLVPPVEASIRISGEPPPVELLSDLRLPYAHVLVVFGADFHLSPRALRSLPTWDGADADRASLTFEPWLTTLGGSGGAMFGVLLMADETGRLHDSVGWLLRVGDERFVVPGRRGKSTLGGMVENLAAAVCFAGWRNVQPGRVPVGRPMPPSNSRPAAAARPDLVREVAIRPKTGTAKSPSFGLAGRSAHIRRAHWHRYRVGPQDDWEYEWRWLAPIFVGGSMPPDDPERVYVLPMPGEGPSWMP
jgi:hypothetical protein